MIFSRTPLRPSGSGWSLCTCQLPSNSSAQPLTPWSTHRGSTARTQSLRARGLVRNNLKLIHSRLRSGLRVWYHSIHELTYRSTYSSLWIGILNQPLLGIKWNIESTTIWNKLFSWIYMYFTTLHIWYLCIFCRRNRRNCCTWHYLHIYLCLSCLDLGVDFN